MMVAVVTGSREWRGSRSEMQRVLGSFGLLVCGDATGADLAAVNVAKKLGLDHGSGIEVHYAADHGKWPSCGPKRNAAIVKRAAELREQGHDVRCFAFPQEGAANKGTNGCMKLMRKAGFAVTVIA
jgi:hypothetical protein